MREEEPHIVRLPTREIMVNRFHGEPVDQRFLPFFTPHASEELTGIGILLVIVYASISIGGLEKASYYVLQFGPKIVDLVVDNPRMNKYVKILIREEFR